VAKAIQRAANPWDRFYRHHESPWRGERAVAEILPHLGKGPVLELGCGNGKLLRPLLASGADAVGLDISFHALSRLPDPHRLVLADAAALPFADASFSAVLDVHCTGHLLTAPRARAMAGMHRVLAPGGKAVVERLSPGDLRAGQGTPVPGEPGVRALADGRTTCFSDADSLAAECAQAGFTVLGAAVERFHPGHRGTQVTRESVRLLLQKSA
jgi:SAM-dependent methyltransferase